MSDSNLHRNTRAGIPREHSMNTGNINQPNPSLGAPHGARPVTRSQAAPAATAGGIDQTPTETHRVFVHAPLHGYNSSTSRTSGQVRLEEERHEESHSTSKSKTHQGSVHVPLHDYNSTTSRAPRREEESHEASRTASSQWPARDKQFQEAPPRASTSGARDKAYSAGETKRNLRKRLHRLQIKMG